MANWKGIEYSGTLANVIEETPDKELAFYDYIDDLSDQIYEAMEDKGWSKADLARATGKSRSWVTQVLAGDKNITMKTFIYILHAMGMTAETKVVYEKQCTWRDTKTAFDYLGLKGSDTEHLNRLHSAKKPVRRGEGKIVKFVEAA